MKELYLLCNAHLDPVWMWQREEGIAEAISTFRVAAQFCEEYDGFLFNHNESLLYEWVEEYEPALFERIKKLVKEGKWHIMGGWYIQPDCVMPSGESFLRQIQIGNKYFLEKFGVKSTTAVNVDPFGHTRGLVQILKKCGYDSYLFMRPYHFVTEQNFIWKGYDGSEVIGHNFLGGYNTRKGKAVDKIDNLVQKADENEAALVLWGIGDHGGGPSKEDIEKIEDYKKAHSELFIKHSFCEEYFSKVDPLKLKTVSESLVHCMVGCYISMVRIKQAHRQLENELSLCEKMLAVSGVSYDPKMLEEAEKALLFNEFHDILPGSCVKKSEEDGLRLMAYGREIVNRYCTKAFFHLCEGQKEGKMGEVPVLVFNPHPYCMEQEIEVEFMLEDQNWNMEVTTVKVRDENGNYVPAQNEKEDSMIHLDWRKRISFRASLKPMSMNRFDCELVRVPGAVRPIQDCCENGKHFVFQNERMEVLINKKTGLIDRFCVDGEELLNKDSGKILVYQDNEDPWGMTVDGFYDRIGEFTAVSEEEANCFNGYPEQKLENVRLIENGDVRARVQVIMRQDASFAVITYTIPKKDTYVDIKIKMLSNDVNRMYKLSFDTAFNGAFKGQSAFGTEESMLKEEKEVTYQKWCALTNGKKGFAVLNRGTYGGSAKDNILNISLLRTPIYTAHPIGERPISDHDRCHDHIDIGEREFEYRLTGDMQRVDALAEMYNQRVFALAFFPPGYGEKKDTSVLLDSEEVILTAYKNVESGRLIRLFHSKAGKKRVTLAIEGKKFEISLNAYEVKTFIFDGTLLKETDMLGMTW